MRRILITGGTGFVGTCMRATQPNAIEGVFVNHYNYDHWRWDIHRWDAIVHLANVSPVKVLGNIARNGGRLLYCSSGAVYHKEHDEYGLNKLLWERDCHEWARIWDLSVVIARLFTFYGAPGKALDNFIREAKKGWPVRIWGDGSAVRSYMSGRELGNLMWAILLRGKSGEAYDVGSDKPVTMLELARRVTGKYPAPILIENGRDRVQYYMPKDAAKTRDLLR